ncbi:Sugar (and other) transporter [Seminavis robusta]|uniref:Sugar (And other) transporter n=1 Tax=Seminavis robusta TaxID=568900 RepID=A0A9N8H730_9STRA|nr:Sugar (and other) transporter [Seminavis robusta]|eukprot:Sro117_g057380.1 Sugar (and other) transporter (607) ;mRNA; r:49108-50928
MDRARLYEYLELQSFSPDEMNLAFRTISTFSSLRLTHDQDDVIDKTQIQAFLVDRLAQIQNQIVNDNQNNVHIQDTDFTEEQRLEYAQQDAERFLQVFVNHSRGSGNNNENGPAGITVSKDQFVQTLTEMATAVDMKRMWPITASILLVGTSVGVVLPAMPFVVEALQLTPGQYGTVVSAFALSKMASNIPSAILVERHGRKPYLTYSLVLIAFGVGGIGFAGSFGELYLCRLLTGAGVAALTTASQLMVTDVSTPLNRATTMSPIVSAFAAGTALGPALGGTMVDQVGLQNTFAMVGASYLGVAILNSIILKETKPPKQPLLHLFHDLPWVKLPLTNQKQQDKISNVAPVDNNNSNNENNRSQTEKDDSTSLATAAKDALAQWIPLFHNDQIRSVMIMNGFYWFALSGSQMTLLPLILTSPAPTGLEMSAGAVGQIYMSMSLVQVLSNPLMARYLVDRIGKAAAISGGCTVIAASMISLPLWTNPPENWPIFVGTLGFWALGSSMLSTAPLAYISDKVTEDKRAQAIAMLRTSGDVGFLLGASCTGGFADLLGGSLDLAMQSSGGLLSAATFWFIVRQKLLWNTNGSAESTTGTTGTSTRDKKRH